MLRRSYRGISLWCMIGYDNKEDNKEVIIIKGKQFPQILLVICFYCEIWASYFSSYASS